MKGEFLYIYKSFIAEDAIYARTSPSVMNATLVKKIPINSREAEELKLKLMLLGLPMFGKHFSRSLLS